MYLIYGYYTSHITYQIDVKSYKLKSDDLETGILILNS